MKSDACEEIKALITELETATSLKVKIIQFDGGGEFLDSKLQAWLTEKGITIEISAPDTQQQNGVAERYNRTTHERALAMMKDANMSDGFWPEEHLYSNHVQNRSPTSALKCTTPYQVFYNKRPDSMHLQTLLSRLHPKRQEEET